MLHGHVQFPQLLERTTQVVCGHCGGDVVGAQSLVRKCQAQVQVLHCFVGTFFAQANHAEAPKTVGRVRVVEAQGFITNGVSPLVALESVVPQTASLVQLPQVAQRTYDIRVLVAENLHLRVVGAAVHISGLLQFPEFLVSQAAVRECDQRCRVRGTQSPFLDGEALLEVLEGLRVSRLVHEHGSDADERARNVRMAAAQRLPLNVQRLLEAGKSLGVMREFIPEFSKVAQTSRDIWVLKTEALVRPNDPQCALVASKGFFQLAKLVPHETEVAEHCRDLMVIGPHRFLTEFERAAIKLQRLSVGAHFAMCVSHEVQQARDVGVVGPEKLLPQSMSFLPLRQRVCILCLFEEVVAIVDEAQNSLLRFPSIRRRRFSDTTAGSRNSAACGGVCTCGSATVLTRRR
mmetsp:Transcript_17501/g.47944  ORF Transcript_17501/g.47944 Transcript_17501/m.47944 type:complete len:404 (+) Transcript_17501:259-1470(+)